MFYTGEFIGLKKYDRVGEPGLFPVFLSDRIIPGYAVVPYLAGADTAAVG